MKNNPRYIVIHCSDCATTIIKDQFLPINDWHKAREFPLSSLGYYGGYQKLVSNGKVYRYRQDDEEGAHTNQVVNGISMNFQSIGICWGGDGDIEFPNATDMQLLRDEVAFYMKKYNLDKNDIFPHRHYATGKTCPGSLLTDEWVRNLGVPKDSEQAEKKENICEPPSIGAQLFNLIKGLF